MKILIVGEYSSFAKNLSSGLHEMGHECFVFSWGDGFKKIKQVVDSFLVEQPLPSRAFVPLNILINRYHLLKSYFKLKRFVASLNNQNIKWDVVLIINPNFIRKDFGDNRFTKRMILSLIHDENNIFISSCGNDVPFIDYWNTQNWKNKPYIDIYSKTVLAKKNIRQFEYLKTFISKVIPMSYGYAEAWRKSIYSQSFTVCPTIPLPIDVSSITPINEIKDKIVIFHGINRPVDKGTHHIVEAMEKLQKTYPNMVECIAKGGMPLDEYLKVLNRANILIDQTYADSTGMNALYGLAMGKVVLGGNEPENAIEYNNNSIPVVNITGDSDQIYKELEKLVFNKDLLIKLSTDSRKYVENYHDCKIVASRYIDVFKKYGVGLV